MFNLVIYRLPGAVPQVIFSGNESQCERLCQRLRKFNRLHGHGDRLYFVEAQTAVGTPPKRNTHAHIGWIATLS